LSLGLILPVLALAGCIVTGESGEMKSLIETIPVQGGSFMYGRNGSTGGTLKTVGSFRMGKYPVTQRQWEEVMGDNPSAFKNNPAEGEAQENRPVENVSWYKILVFANKLSVKEGMLPAYEIKGSTDPEDWGDVPTANDEDWDAVKVRKVADGWRLPTELQWEYAAKGGTRSAGYTGRESDTYFLYPGSDDADAVAWYTDNSGGKTHAVGKKKPNELGLYDMGGNVYEWCFDLYDPTGASSGSDRVLRGGCWGDSAGLVRSAYRISRGPFIWDGVYGFRLVRPA